MYHLQSRYGKIVLERMIHHAVLGVEFLGMGETSRRDLVTPSQCSRTKSCGTSSKRQRWGHSDGCVSRRIYSPFESFWRKLFVCYCATCFRLWQAPGNEKKKKSQPRLPSCSVSYNPMDRTLGRKEKKKKIREPSDAAEPSDAEVP